MHGLGQLRTRGVDWLRSLISLRAWHARALSVQQVVTIPRVLLLLLSCFWVFKTYIKWATRHDFLEAKGKAKTFLVFADATSHGFRAFSTALDWKRPQDTLIVIYALILRSRASMEVQPLMLGVGRAEDPERVNRKLHSEASMLCKAYKNYCSLLQTTNVTVCEIFIVIQTFLIVEFSLTHSYYPNE
jgi:hypothetical protein